MKNYQTLDAINTCFSTDTQSAVYAANEAFHVQLQKIADEIKGHVQQRPLILIAGPSGSGKTTTAKMLAEIFTKAGIHTYSIPLDNYFRTISPEDHARIANGTIDLESPDRLNRELLQDHLEKLLACKPVTLPYYDFATTTSRCSKIRLQRNPEDLVILEGIHALNPEVIPLPQKQRYAFYVSIHTHLSYKGTTMHPLYIRLMRRMIRDQQFRGRTVLQTLAMLQEVERGKRHYIKPFRCYATHEIDTFFPYELGVYRSFLLPELEKAPAEETVSMLCKMLRGANPIAASQIPADSLICEFLGNSTHA
jgi:uridine kinase